MKQAKDMKLLEYLRDGNRLIQKCYFLHKDGQIRRETNKSSSKAHQLRSGFDVVIRQTNQLCPNTSYVIMIRNTLDGGRRQRLRIR